MVPPPILTVEQTRTLDERAALELNIPTLTLMERAGKAVAERVESLSSSFSHSRAAWIFCGTGNNGGDGLVAARHLIRKKVPVRIFIAGCMQKLRGDAGQNLQTLLSMKVKTENIPDFAHFLMAARPFEHIVIIDALLGTGFHGELRSPVLEAAQTINEIKCTLKQKARVLSIDIPSGLNGDTGAAARDAVRADVTLTMACLKKGLAHETAIQFCGKIEIVDIGIPEELIQSVAANNLD